MGQRFSASLDANGRTLKPSYSFTAEQSFPDLNLLPPEIGLKILSSLDVCEVRSVQPIWTDLANDEFIWQGLCYQSWKYCTAYRHGYSKRGDRFWMKLYSHLEKGTEMFNSQPVTEFENVSIKRFFPEAVDDEPSEISRFIHNTELLSTQRVLQLLQYKPGVLEDYVSLKDFTNKFLPIALRSFFFSLSVATQRQTPFVHRLLERFSHQYCLCNKSFNKDAVVVLCHSLLLLSNDLCNPTIKNKMSKREFIKNTTQALENMDRHKLDTDYLGHVYDNVYLIGHIAPQRIDDS